LFFIITFALFRLNTVYAPHKVSGLSCDVLGTLSANIYLNL
uniref:Uncharacterized protein n=1 Tax=Parascaris univalens TaxID=6257 RepID=A0A914ZKE8_PARUN